MANVRFLRQLPQTYGLTGRKTRTPINVKYSSKPSLSSLFKMPERVMANLERLAPIIQKKQVVQEEINPDFGGGPGVGPGEGVGGMSGDVDTAGVTSAEPGVVAGNIAAGNIAGSVLGRGAKGGLLTGILGLTENAPVSAIAPVAIGSATQSALSPIGLANIIGGQALSAQNALDAAETPSGIEAAMANQPGTLTGFAQESIADMFGIPAGKGIGTTSKGITDLSLSDISFGEATNAANAMSDAAEAADISIEGIGDISAAEAEFGGSSSGPSSGGNVGIGEGGQGYGGGESGDVGGGGPTVICTELHNQGLMSDKIYKADCAYGASLDYEVMDGYLVCGKPLASLMARSRLVTAIIKYPALKWAEHMAGNHNLFGAIAVRIGIPMCRCISRMKRLVKCQLRSTSQ